MIEMVEGGTGAERQLADWRADRDLRALVRKIVGRHRPGDQRPHRRREGPRQRVGWT